MLFFIPIIWLRKDRKYGPFLTIPFGDKNIRVFTNLSLYKKERVKKTIRVDQKLPTPCSLTDETMKVLKNFALPEVEFETQSGQNEFSRFLTKELVMQKN